VPTKKTARAKNVDDRTDTKFIPGFSVPITTLNILDDLVMSGRNVNCTNIEQPYFWQDHWKKCPLCGADVELDGGIEHREMQ
jgi:hypothetical protein